MANKYWLFKSEPDSFSIDDLESAPNKTTCWDGVRNYQARNFLRDKIALGDQVFFYHSNAEPPAIIGIAKIVKAGYPDPSALDPRSDYFDEKSNPKNPTWYSVDIKHVKTFQKPISLSELKKRTKLGKMVLLQKGGRLSIQPVSSPEWQTILAMT